MATNKGQAQMRTRLHETYKNENVSNNIQGLDIPANRDEIKPALNTPVTNTNTPQCKDTIDWAIPLHLAGSLIIPGVFNSLPKGVASLTTLLSSLFIQPDIDVSPKERKHYAYCITDALCPLGLMTVRDEVGDDAMIYETFKVAPSDDAARFPRIISSAITATDGDRLMSSMISSVSDRKFTDYSLFTDPHRTNQRKIHAALISAFLFNLSHPSPWKYHTKGTVCTPYSTLNEVVDRAVNGLTNLGEAYLAWKLGEPDSLTSACFTIDIAAAVMEDLGLLKRFQIKLKISGESMLGYTPTALFNNHKNTAPFYT